MVLLPSNALSRAGRNNCRAGGAAAIALGCGLVLGVFSSGPRAWANPAPPPVAVNGGLSFESQSGGTPNSFSGYLFAPLSQGKQGQVLFLDLSASLNLGGALLQQNNVSAGGSSRLGYRWLSGDQRWLYGINAGIDSRQAYTQYAFQAGVGAEALSRNLELRANGYIPFSNQADRYATGFSNAGLRSNLLFLDGWNQYVVSLGGLNLEAGLPAARWSGNSLWLYASYYYLSGNYVSGSSGVSGRAELRMGDQFSLGARLAYDDIFSFQASGYVRYGSRPLKTTPGAAIAAAERDFLALRGLPMQREADIRMVNAQQNLPATVATNPLSGTPWIVRCTGTTLNTLLGSVQCADASLGAMLATTGGGEVLLVGGAAGADLAGAAADAQGRPTLNLPAATVLTAAANAPTLPTQFGNANLAGIFGVAIGTQPTLRNGVLQIGSDSTIAGLGFSNASLTSVNSRNLVISGNRFVGSYSDNPTDLTTAQAYGAINVSERALPAIQLEGIQRLTIAGNSFLYPQVQTYLSQTGEGGRFVCNQNRDANGDPINTQGLCLSGNAIRLNNISATRVDGNSVVGALDEAFRINNPSGQLIVNGNAVSGMRMGPDSNIGTAIIVGQNQGSSNVTIANNLITDNSRGVYLKVDDANQSGIPVFIADPTKDPNRAAKNVADPIEIGLCRGSDSYPSARDLYASSDFSGNCANPTSMNLTIIGNISSLPAIVNGIQDGDGIDLNIGRNAVLRGSIENNNIFTLGNLAARNIGDNGLTFDFRDNSDVRLDILNNFIFNAGDAGIGFGIQNTSLIDAPGLASITLRGNRFGDNQFTGIPTVEADFYKKPGLPVSTANFFGIGDNELTRANVSFERPADPGSYPRLFVNNIQIEP